MSAVAPVGRDALVRKGWLRAHAWLIARRACQVGVFGLFALGPLLGVWVVKGNLGASMTLDVLPLADPFVVVQSLAAGHVPASTLLLGAAVVLALYALVGGRAYCSWLCPVNILTDAAHWLRERMGLGPGWQPPRATRIGLLVAALVVSAALGNVAWEMVNPVTMLHRGLLYGVGLAWVVVLAVVLLDLLVGRRVWCGRLCPVGAFYGLLGRISLTRVSAARRGRCNDCMDCIAVCPEPHVIMPVLKGAERGIGPVILSGDCTNCGRCIDVCGRQVFRFRTRFGNTAARSEPRFQDRPGAERGQRRAYT